MAILLIIHWLADNENRILTSSNFSKRHFVVLRSRLKSSNFGSLNNIDFRYFLFFVKQKCLYHEVFRFSGCVTFLKNIKRKRFWLSLTRTENEMFQTYINQTKLRISLHFSRFLKEKWRYFIIMSQHNMLALNFDEEILFASNLLNHF